MLLREIKNIFHKELDALYPKEEVNSFFYLLIAHYFNLERFVLAMQPDYIISKEEEQPMFEALAKLRLHKPIQYITGMAHFMDIDFTVNENVLIPRPETEELVRWVIEEVSTKYRVQSTKYEEQSTEYKVKSTKYEVENTKYKVKSTKYEEQSTKYEEQSEKNEVQSTEYKVKSTKYEVENTKYEEQSEKNKVQSENSLKILDIGTGSGCIAISLAKNLPDAKIYALDVSTEALKVAKKNAVDNELDIEFIQSDILKINALNSKFDVIVSNPPYVRMLEKKEMNANVLENEPDLALFVSDDNPLIFYKKITAFATKNLNVNGCLFFEINQYLGKETQQLLSDHNFSEIELRKDMFGNNRMLMGKLM